MYMGPILKQDGQLIQYGGLPIQGLCFLDGQVDIGPSWANRMGLT